MPKKLQAPEPPTPEIRRDSAGKIVEYDATGSVPLRAPVKYDLRASRQAAPAASTGPRTLAQVRSEFSLRRKLVEDSYRELFYRKNVELSCEVGPVIQERDQAVAVARAALDARIRDLKQEEAREVARATKTVRESFAAARKREETVYEALKARAHSKASDGISSVEAKLQACAKAIRDKKDVDLLALEKLQAEAEANVRAVEKPAAETEASQR